MGTNHSGLQMQQAFTGVIVSDKSADIYSLKTLRSMQAVISSAIYGYLVKRFLGNQRGSYPVAGITLSKKDSVDYKRTPPRKFLTSHGNEGQRISPSWLKMLINWSILTHEGRRRI